MWEALRQAWSREAVGYKQGELEDGDAVATMVVVLIGGPAFVMGAVLAGRGLGLGQILLVAPVGALLGAMLIGTSAAKAAQTGANGTWLLRPPFGRAGSVPVSLLRLAAVVIWAIVALQMVGEWTAAASAGLGLDVPAPVWVAAVAALGFLLVLFGLVRTVRLLIRKPLFMASVVLVGVVAWQLAGELAVPEGDGAFWEGVQLTAELAVVFLPFVEAIGRRLRDDEVAMTSFSVAYAVPATLMFTAGAFVVPMLDAESVGIGTGTIGLVVLIAWVVVAEVDQAFASFVAAGAEAVGVVRTGAPWLVGIAMAVAIVAGAVALPAVSVALASLSAAIVLPAALIAAVDFHLAKDNYYTEADIYGGTEHLVNVTGVGCWVVAVLAGQLLDPVGPTRFVDMFPTTAVSEVDLPWRLIAAVVGATVYLLVERWSRARSSAVYGVRDVSSYEAGGDPR